MATSEPAQPARRLRAADVIDQQAAVIAALLDRGGGENSSVVLNRNAKGETQIEITVRTDANVITSADAAMAKARELYDAACTAYPAGSGFIRNEGQAGPGKGATK